MNTLHWIAIALFVMALVSGLLLFIEATFLLFTAGVLVLSIATYVKDRAESRD
jgi:cytochrome b subunit of formate dehydrogenase